MRSGGPSQTERGGSDERPSWWRKRVGRDDGVGVEVLDKSPPTGLVGDTGVGRQKTSSEGRGGIIFRLGPGTGPSEARQTETVMQAEVGDARVGGDGAGRTGPTEDVAEGGTLESSPTL